MPSAWAFLLRVQEDGDIPKVVVVLYDVGQVGIAFVAFVDLGMQSCRAVVDRVYRAFPSDELSETFPL